MYVFVFFHILFTGRKFLKLFSSFPFCFAVAAAPSKHQRRTEYFNDKEGCHSSSRSANLRPIRHLLATNVGPHGMHLQRGRRGRAPSCRHASNNAKKKQGGPLRHGRRCAVRHTAHPKARSPKAPRAQGTRAPGVAVGLAGQPGAPMNVAERIGPSISVPD